MGKFSDFIFSLFGNAKLIKTSRELRAHQRIKVNFMASLEQGKQNCSGVILNFSEGGVKVRLEGFPNFDSKQLIYLVLHTPDAPTRVAFTIVWQVDNLLGLKVSGWDEWLKVMPMLSDVSDE